MFHYVVILPRFRVRVRLRLNPCTLCVAVSRFGFHLAVSGVHLEVIKHSDWREILALHANNCGICVRVCVLLSLAAKRVQL